MNLFLACIVGFLSIVGVTFIFYISMLGMED